MENKKWYNPIKELYDEATTDIYHKILNCLTASFSAGIFMVLSSNIFKDYLTNFQEMVLLCFMGILIFLCFYSIEKLDILWFSIVIFTAISVKYDINIISEMMNFLIAFILVSIIAYRTGKILSLIEGKNKRVNTE